MKAPVPHAWRWRNDAIDALHGDVARCRTPVRKRVQSQRVHVVVDGRRMGCAWGQFLDPDHHSGTHWGRFGSSAAVQVLALDLHWTRSDTLRRRVMDAHPLRQLADGVLPESKPEAPRLKPSDFDDPMKIAFVIDALNADACEEVVQGNHPQLVETLLGMAVDEEGWSTRPPEDEERNEKDRLLITAYALHVLRRYPQAQSDARIRGAWTWLAHQLIDGRQSLGQDVLALGALALVHAPEELRTNAVEQAIETCLSELRTWAAKLSAQIVNRPYFNSYSRGEDGDYLFLSPELLTAILFLKTGNPRPTRAFVLWVVRAVADNIVPPYLPPQQREQAHGFSVQRTMEGTVDQMWALRLLRAFHLAYVQSRRDLRPSRIPWPSLLGLLSLSSVAAIVVGAQHVDDWGGLTATLVAGAVLSAVIGVLIIDWRASRLR